MALVAALKHPKGTVGKRSETWIARTNDIVGEGRALYRAVVNADLEARWDKSARPRQIP